MQQLLGKQLALVSDMQLGPRTDVASIAENLLRISGEDFITIPRKFKGEWNGKIAARFVFLTNKAFKLKDTSGALANRFISLVLIHSFLGREDLRLSRKLRAELPGILLWAKNA